MYLLSSQTTSLKCQQVEKYFIPAKREDICSNSFHSGWHSPDTIPDESSSTRYPVYRDNHLFDSDMVGPDEKRLVNIATWNTIEEI